MSVNNCLKLFLDKWILRIIFNYLFSNFLWVLDNHLEQDIKSYESHVH